MQSLIAIRLIALKIIVEHSKLRGREIDAPNMPFVLLKEVSNLRKGKKKSILQSQI